MSNRLNRERSYLYRGQLDEDGLTYDDELFDPLEFGGLDFLDDALADEFGVADLDREHESGVEGYAGLDEFALDTEDRLSGEARRRSREYVKWLQRALNRILGSRLSVDGNMGRNTRGAIKRFQQRAGLTVDGVVGPQTETALIANGAEPPPGIPSAPTSSSRSGFHPVPVEVPGGGRIRDKSPPAAAEIVTVQGVRGRAIELQRLAAGAHRAMLKDARTAGIKRPLLLPVSGYRSPQRQARLWKRALKKYGSPQEARKWVAPPRGSAHQTGRAIDYYLGGRNSSGNVRRLRTLPAYKWLVANAETFGFYPYRREPWHWEYNPPAAS